MRRVRVIFHHPSGSVPVVGPRLLDLNRVFAPAAITFESGGTSPLSPLGSVDIGACPHGSSLMSAAQKALFDQVSLQPGDIAVFLANAVKPAADGCSTHPPGKPGLVLARDAARWVFAHEVGHLLDLFHDGSSRLMVDDPKTLPDEPAPALSTSERDLVALSPIPQDVLAPAMATAGVEEALPVPRARPTPTPRLEPKAKGRRPATSISAGRGITRLAADALASLSRRRTPDVINRVAATIEADAALRRRYHRLVRAHGRAAVHAGIGRHVRHLTKMASSGRTRKGTSLLATYAVLRRR